MGDGPASMLRTVMVQHGRSVAGIPRFSAIPRCQLRQRASLLDSTISRGRRQERQRGSERTIERRGSQPSILTENSGQTSGRLDETAERHETEGKRKWQGLSEGASTPSFPPSLSLVPASPSFASGTEGGRAADKLRRGLGRGITLSFAFNVYNLRYLRIDCFTVRV